MSRLPDSGDTAKCDFCPATKCGECQLCGGYVCGMCCQPGTPKIDGSLVCSLCFWHHHSANFYFD